MAIRRRQLDPRADRTAADAATLIAQHATQVPPHRGSRRCARWMRAFACDLGRWALRGWGPRQLQGRRRLPGVLGAGSSRRGFVSPRAVWRLAFRRGVGNAANEVLARLGLLRGVGLGVRERRGYACNDEICVRTWVSAPRARPRGAVACRAVVSRHPVASTSRRAGRSGAVAHWRSGALGGRVRWCNAVWSPRLVSLDCTDQGGFPEACVHLHRAHRRDADDGAVGLVGRACEDLRASRVVQRPQCLRRRHSPC